MRVSNLTHKTTIELVPCGCIFKTNDNKFYIKTQERDRSVEPRNLCVSLQDHIGERFWLPLEQEVILVKSQIKDHSNKIPLKDIPVGETFREPESLLIYLKIGVDYECLNLTSNGSIRKFKYDHIVIPLPDVEMVISQ